MVFKVPMDPTLAACMLWGIIVASSFSCNGIGNPGIISAWGFQGLHQYPAAMPSHRINTRRRINLMQRYENIVETSRGIIPSSLSTIRPLHQKSMMLQAKSKKDEEQGGDDDDDDDDFSTTKPIVEEIKNFYPTSMNNRSKNINTINNNNNITSTNSTMSNTNSTINSSPYMQTIKEEVVGIGGKGGYIYDVNKLKSNLIQKSIKQFKNDLLKLLIEPPSTSIASPSTASAAISKQLSKKSPSKKEDLSLKKLTQKKKQSTKSQPSSTSSSLSATTIQAQQNYFIDEKISALVSTNPVSTTTDSNLLEGEWDFAYSTNNAAYILKDSRVVLSRKRQSSANVSTSSHAGSVSDDKDGSEENKKVVKWKLKSQDSDNFIITSNTRHICLENLEDDEDPYMIDKTSYVDGLAMIERRFKIVGLTRTNLEVQPVSKTQYLLGRRVTSNEMDLDEIDATDESLLSPMITDLQFIYLDSDLCITMIGDESGTLNVYTKNAEWRESRKKKSRVLKESMIRLSKIESPLHLRRRLVSLFRKSEQSSGEFDLNKISEEEYQILLRRVYADKESKLMALRLGDVGSNDDEDAWEGDEDPFVHLTADERQEIMKQMSIEEITEAGSNHKRLMMKLEKKKKGFKHQKKFKRPSFGWEGEGKRQ